MEKKEKNTGSDENNKIAAENHAKKKLNYDKFFLNFEKEYKLIKVNFPINFMKTPINKTKKKLTHECQYKCYNTEKSTSKEAEHCARICLRPYMSLRESNAQRLDNCEVNS